MRAFRVLKDHARGQAAQNHYSASCKRRRMLLICAIDVFANDWSPLLAYQLRPDTALPIFVAASGSQGQAPELLGTGW